MPSISCDSPPSQKSISLRKASPTGSGFMPGSVSWKSPHTKVLSITDDDDTYADDGVAERFIYERNFLRRNNNWNFAQAGSHRGTGMLQLQKAEASKLDGSQSKHVVFRKDKPIVADCLRLMKGVLPLAAKHDAFPLMQHT